MEVSKRTECNTENWLRREMCDIAKRKTHERVALVVDPLEFALTRPIGAPVRGETTLEPADPGRWLLLLRGRPDERRADDDA